MAFDFKAAALKAKTTKSFEKAIKGSNYNFLEEGVHEVTIAGVDSANVASKGYVRFTFEDGRGKVHNENMFLAPLEGYGKKGEEEEVFSRAITRLLAGTLKAEVVQGAFMDELAANPEVFNMMTGMSTKIVLKRGNGYIIKMNADKQFAAYDVKTDTILTGLYTDVDAVKTEAGAKNLKRSQLKIFEARLTHADENAKRLHTAIESRAAAKARAEGLNSGFSAGVKSVGGIL
jgi:hypothetical protein